MDPHWLKLLTRPTCALSCLGLTERSHIMSNADVAHGVPAARSPAQERRLRKRRQEARIRMHLAADAALLASHHASAAPCGPPPLPGVFVTQAELAALRNEIAELRAQVKALQTGATCAMNEATVSATQEHTFVAMEEDGKASDVEERLWRVVNVKEGDAPLCYQHVFAEKSFTARYVRPLLPDDVIAGHLEPIDSIGIQWVHLANEDGFVAVATVDSYLPGLGKIEGCAILEPLDGTATTGSGPSMKRRCQGIAGTSRPFG